VPYDAILIMINRDQYGGGGIYNWQTVFNTGSKWRDYVFLHEFAHAFAEVGDEYFLLRFLTLISIHPVWNHWKPI
jgi:hypothetical protein